MIDVEKVRAQTRGCEQVLHFNSAGSSLMPIPVSDALLAFLKREEMEGGYETASREADALDNFYHATARLLNCSIEEVAFVENATRAWDMAFYSLEFQPGDRILTGIAEYGSNVIAYLQQAERHGVRVEFVPDDEHGQLDVAALESMLDERVKLISVSQIPTGGGLINPVADVGRVARSAGVPFLLDACQTVGQLPVDVEAIGCDMLSGTGRKYLRGPRGTGFLYVRKALIESMNPPLLDQHAADLISPTSYRIRPDAKRFENWEQFFAGKAALGVAVDYAVSLGIDNIRDRVVALASTLRRRLESMDGVRTTDVGRERCGITTFVAEQMDAEAIQAALSRHAINVSVSDGSGSLVSFEKRGLRAVVRASVHYFNTEEEIDRFIATLAGILGTQA